MKLFPLSLCRGLLLASTLLASATSTLAADVRVGISAKDTYVGLPIVLQIQVNNATDVKPPVVPSVDGLEIQSRGTPSQSTQITSINGQTTKTTSLTYVYEVTPTRTGSFRVPPITIEVDGAPQQTRAIEFVASKSETGDLLFVEIAGKEKQIYVGQALDLTLKIWVRPFRDAERDITLSASDMWQMISPRSHWGVFGDRIAQMANNGERPRATEVIRKDRNGVEHGYYLYEVETTIYPKRSGKIDADNVHVIVQYPTELGTARDPFASMFDDMRMPGGFKSMFGSDDFPSPFGPRLTVQSVRPIVADAAVEPIDVLSIPTIGRPDDYRGAVGHYRIVTEAKPGTVKAGDPIELLIGVVGTGPMELVQAPPLNEIAALANDFKVPSEPLAGFVQDDRKLFSTTIRPRREGITEIPAIPFSYFDPQQGKFVTVRSDPISIHVEPADTLALDAIVGSHAKATHSDEPGRANSSLAATSFENDTDKGLLTNERSHEPSRAILFALLVLPPAVVFGIGIVRNRDRVSQLLSRLGAGSRKIQYQIMAAKDADEVCRVLQSYLVRRLALQSGSQDTTAILGALRTSGEHKLAVECERIFHAARESFAGVGQMISLSDLQSEALTVISHIQRLHENKHARPQRRRSGDRKTNRSTPQRGKRIASQIVGLVVLATTFAWTSSAVRAASTISPDAQSTASKIELSTTQRQAILEEATKLYQNAMTLVHSDSADAKDAFAAAAEKYQLLVDSGPANSRLYTNLANADLQAGHRGVAIANYLRALEIDPTSRQAQVNLTHARQLVTGANSNGDHNSSKDFENLLSAAAEWLAQNVSSSLITVIGLAAWFGFWLVIGLRVFGLHFPSRSLAASALMIALIAAGILTHGDSKPANSLAIVTSSEATLHEGDGAHFPTAGDPLHEGESLDVIKQRGGWLQVRSTSGQMGWVASNNVEVV